MHRHAAAGPLDLDEFAVLEQLATLAADLRRPCREDTVTGVPVQFVVVLVGAWIAFNSSSFATAFWDLGDAMRVRDARLFAFRALTLSIFSAAAPRETMPTISMLVSVVIGGGFR